MKQFINEKETVVTEAIEGVIAASNGKLTRLDGFPHIKVVLRSEIDRAKVALVSGGGSGHEPAHAGFVGQGMLSAAVCGDVSGRCRWRRFGTWRLLAGRLFAYC